MYTKRPPNTLVRIMAIIIGVIIVPDWVALTPTTHCMKRGTNMMAPNMPIAMKKPIPFSMENVRFLNRETGRIGSSVLFSMKTNAISDIRATINIVIICHEPHSYFSPPKLSASRRATTPMTIVTVPAISSLTGPLLICFGKPFAIKITASTPTGRLI
ncbi:hypothetical protein D3C81_1186280 [compost metagenome]